MRVVQNREALPSTRKRAGLVAGGILAAAALLAWRTALRFGAWVGIDDANIYFRYAQNLVRGHGFVFNPGGEPVEGFTSMLWLGVVWLVEVASLPVEGTLLALSVVLLSATVTILVLATSAQESDSRVRMMVCLVVGLWCFVSPNFVAWTTVSLMETGLYTALFTCGVACLMLQAVRGGGETFWRRLFSLTVMLLPWARPEGALVGATLIALSFGVHLGTAERRAALRSILPFSVAWALSCAGVLIVRWVLFGALVPNTFHAKVSRDTGYRLARGIDYLVSFLGSGGIGTALAIGCALWFATEGALRLGARISGGTGALVPADLTRLSIGGAALLGLAIPVAVGGDFFGGSRFFQPVWPTLGVALALAFAWAWRRAAWSRIAVRRSLATVGALGAIWVVGGYQRQGVAFADQFSIPAGGRLLGQVLTALVADIDPRPVVGMSAVGGFGVTWDGPIFDLLGLNDREMGRSPGGRRGIQSHAGFDLAVFWRRPPEILMPTLGTRREIRSYREKAIEPGSFKDQTLRGLLRSDRFGLVYEAFEADLACLQSELSEVPEQQLKNRHLFFWSRRGVPLSHTLEGCRVRSLPPPA